MLTERYYAWQEAKELAKLDPQVNLTGHGPAYDPMIFEVKYKDSEGQFLVC